MLTAPKGESPLMTQPIFIVQASSRSWSGGPDLCMNPVEGQPAVVRTIARALEVFPKSRLIVVAPEFDREGSLDKLVAEQFGQRVQIHYGQNDSPLNRMLAATASLPDETYLIRVDGVHFCFDTDAPRAMLQQALRDNLDTVKFPDDFPVQFGCDVYRLGALRILDRMLNTDEDRVFRVHPKFFQFAHPQDFNCAYTETLPEYTEDYLHACRKRARAIYAIPRLEVNDQRLWVGDQLSFHYELASRFLTPSMKVLDIACGDGYGARLLSGQVAEIHGGDIDAENVQHARNLTTQLNVKIHVEDVTATSFPDEHFDAVLSLETIEHVDAIACIRELSRILRPNGILILSTPQNRLGKIPINTAHQREYSLDEIKEICENCFTVREIIGIKAGRIVIEDDPIGSNIVLICEKPT